MLRIVVVVIDVGLIATEALIIVFVVSWSGLTTELMTFICIIQILVVEGVISLL